MAVDLFNRLNNAVLDLQSADYQSFGRPLKIIGQLLDHQDLARINAKLIENVDLESFLLESSKSARSQIGTAKLAWPDDHQQGLGLTLLLIQRFSKNPDETIQFAYEYYHSGSSFVQNLHALTRQMIIPFVRDYRDYVMREGDVRPSLVSRTSNKVFIVHGHDGESRSEVARFIEKLGLEAIILHERPNKGRTIITKFQEESAEVGFAVVLMTPDDIGGPAFHPGDDLNPRARQNVVFELGFFIGALGGNRVAGLVKGRVERPSDFEGVVYISLDSGAWKMELGRELKEAGYLIDWNRVLA